MKKRAVDIVILPPAEVVDAIIAIDGRSADVSGIALNTTDRFPHISLLMGVLDDSSMPEIIDSLTAIARETKPFEITLERYGRTRHGFGHLSPRKNSSLQNLHEKILDRISHLLGYEADEFMFTDKEISPEYIKHVNTFLERSAGDNFNPHITVRAQTKIPPELPISFIADTLAVFQMGQRCTSVSEIARFRCRK